MDTLEKARAEPTSASSGQFSLQPAHAASQQEPPRENSDHVILNPRRFRV